MAVAQPLRRPIQPQAAPPVRGLAERPPPPRQAAIPQQNADEAYARTVGQTRDAHRTRMDNLDYDVAYRNSIGQGGVQPWSVTPPQAVQQEQEPLPIDYNALRTLMQTATPPPIAAPDSAEDKRISDSAFARAKDNAGLLALRRSADARTRATAMGVSGGGAEIAAQSAIEGDVVDNLTGVSQAQAEQEAARRYGVADRNYAGALQQRGQDISLRPSLLSLYQQSRRRY